MQTAHGLSLYIETQNHKILFDVGCDDTLLVNAERLGVDIREVDTVIISHGHRDHGGALGEFLLLNNSAKVYVQRRAFLPHFSHRREGVSDISLDRGLMEHPQVVLLDGDFRIDEELVLFRSDGGRKCWSGANGSLYEGDEVDGFLHEQNLVIKDREGSVLVMGCGHNGVVNIMERAEEYEPRVCVGGFHLTSPSAGRDEPRELLDGVVEELRRYGGVRFLTCHCTGERVYEYMSKGMSNLGYLGCGDLVEL